MNVGDIIPVRFRVAGSHASNKLPECQGVVLAINNGEIVFRYLANSPLFAGLRGTIKFPKRSSNVRY